MTAQTLTSTYKPLLHLVYSCSQWLDQQSESFASYNRITLKFYFHLSNVGSVLQSSWYLTLIGATNHGILLRTQLGKINSEVVMDTIRCIFDVNFLQKDMIAQIPFWWYTPSADDVIWVILASVCHVHVDYVQWKGFTLQWTLPVRKQLKITFLHFERDFLLEGPSFLHRSVQMRIKTTHLLIKPIVDRLRTSIITKGKSEVGPNANLSKPIFCWPYDNSHLGVIIVKINLSPFIIHNIMYNKYTHIVHLLYKFPKPSLYLQLNSAQNL